MRNNICVDIFVASSTEKLKVAERIAEHFNRLAKLCDKSESISAQTWKVYFESKPGEYCWETICSAVSEFDYAIFLLGKDDDAEIRGEKYKVTRDNVLVEAGAFMSNLPSSHVRCYYARGVKIPSDFSGINHQEFSFSSRQFTQKDIKALDNLFESCKQLTKEKIIYAEKEKEKEAGRGSNRNIGSDKIYRTGKDVFMN